MGYWTLLKRNPRSIGFGFFNAFFSGLGQTHFVSIFSPVIMTQFALSNAQYGSLYSLITLASGLCITFLGPLIDRFDARFFALFIGIGLAISEFLFITEFNIVTLAVALFGLRLFGQGLCSSISSITVARYFEDQRGKALSLSQMGYPVYEGLITPLMAFLLLQSNLQFIGLLLIASVLFIYIPLTFTLTRRMPRFNHPILSSAENEEREVVVNKDWNRKQVLTDRTIYLILPQVLMPPFTLTGLFFHQAAIANNKGWTLSLMASGLAFFAMGRVINTFVTGPLVDRYKAYRLFPYYQLPLALGFLIMSYYSAFWIPALSFTLFGLTVGSGGPIKSAIWAELYGIQHLGAIKSLFATFMIFSTAASPALFGWILDSKDNASFLLMSLFGVTIVASMMSWFALRHFEKQFGLGSQ